MKTQLLDSRSPSLPVWLGFPKRSALVQPSLDSLPAAASRLVIIPKALFTHQFPFRWPYPYLVPPHISVSTSLRLPKTRLCMESCWVGACVLRCSLHPQLKEMELRPRTKVIWLNESGNRAPPITSFHSLLYSFCISKAQIKPKVFVLY